MIQRGIWLLAIFCSLVVSDGRGGTEIKNEAGKWEGDIRAFEQWDRKNTFARDAVLFVGSSSIQMWPTAECFREFPVINRGFGGSQISEVNYFAERIVLRYEPKVIVFYAGDNDVAHGKNAHSVFGDYKKFVKLVHAKLPETRIIFISIKPSESRWSLWPVMCEANILIKSFSAMDKRMYYFDGVTPLMDDSGKPNEDLFLDDKLHLNDKGYAVWTRLLTPIIKGTLNTSD